ncbi:MAG TPA: hypothetical protein VGE36_13585 [Roseateles sp.]
MTADPLVLALIRLIGGVDNPGRRKEVATEARCNEQTLYQIAKGVPLKSGKERGVGREIRDKLDKRFPGWRDGVAVDEQAAVVTPADALPVALESLRNAPQHARAELAQVLGLLVTTGSALYAQRVGELLVGEPGSFVAVESVAQPLSMSPTVVEWRRQAMRLAESHPDLRSRALLTDFLGKLDTLMREAPKTEKQIATRQKS